MFSRLGLRFVDENFSPTGLELKRKRDLHAESARAHLNELCKTTRYFEWDWTAPKNLKTHYDHQSLVKARWSLNDAFALQFFQLLRTHPQESAQHGLVVATRLHGS